MNDLLRSIILGIVEGLTEFLPVSSTGHMIIVAPLIGVDTASEYWQSFIYFVQIGAILAVVLYFRRRLWDMTMHRPHRPAREHLLVKLAVAFLPAAVVGLAFDDAVEAWLDGPVTVAIALIVGAALIEWIERTHLIAATESTDEMTLRQALLIGVAQCLAIVPGTSRSAATIMGGLLVGLSAPAAAEFSFFLAIPTIFAAGGYKLLKYRAALTADNAAVLAAGFLTAFIVAYFVVAGFMRYIQTHRFRAFSVYRVVLGVIVLIWYWRQVAPGRP